jgi:hypothetical protein
MKKIITLNESQLINLINKWVSNHIINEGRNKKFVSKPVKYYLDKIIFKNIDKITGENCFTFAVSNWDEGERPGFSGMVNYYKDSFERYYKDGKALLNTAGDVIAVGDIYSSSSITDVTSHYEDAIKTWMDQNITPEIIKKFIADNGYKTKADFLNDANNNLSTNIHTIYTQAKKSGILDKIFNEPSIKKLKDAKKYKYGVNPNMSAEQILDWVIFKGYETIDDMKNDVSGGGKYIYNNMGLEKRKQITDLLGKSTKEKRTNKTKKNIVKSRDRYNYYSASTNPNINLKYSVEESVRKILKTII